MTKTKILCMFIIVVLMLTITALVFVPPFRLSGSINVNLKWNVAYVDPLAAPVPTPNTTNAMWMP